MEVQGITKGKTATSRRASVTITLGWERVYVFDVWIMDHNAGVDVVLGTDFMIPAGVRPDLFNATAKLPDEVMVPLIKTQNLIDETEGSHVVGGPTEVLQIPGREWRDFRLQRRQPPPTTHVVWIRRTEAFMPTITRFYKQRPARVRLTNLTDKLVSCPVHLPVVVWVPAGSLPRDVGYVRLDSAEYREWQVLALPTFGGGETRLHYPNWGILQRPPENSEDEMSSADDWSNDNDGSVVAMGDANLEETHNDNYQFETTSGKTSGEHTNRAESEDIDSDNSQTTGVECKDSTMSPLQVLENTLISVIRVLTTERNEASNTSADNPFEHLTAEIGLEDYAHELAFLPDLTEISATELDFSAPNVQNPELTTDQQRRLVGVLEKHRRIMISSGNAIPLPAYGVVCDINAQGHEPIKQRAQRIRSS
ncbi:unnamed protein product [Phytophthora lilii]|uniref:Unnamed protein product n=1 Tax=Phytophthora lilii TaxID=2077276 RepID=A0A9W6XL80_9STRA|nr:unnamed protein product [Phytophthora lilii]